MLITPDEDPLLLHIDEGAIQKHSRDFWKLISKFAKNVADSLGLAMDLGDRIVVPEDLQSFIDDIVPTLRDHAFGRLSFEHARKSISGNKCHDPP